MIQFLLNNEPVMLQQRRGDVTVLEWLREVRVKTGTKEGCGSGDCGACTVVIASLVKKNNQLRLHYESANSCITFAGALHGKQLITVEDLATVDGLHPVQQAMVDEHGSQCGFCTPGFIMSMFALYHSNDIKKLSDNPQELDHLIDRYLGGNLCRCTGYLPIKRATIAAIKNHTPDQFDANAIETIKTLRDLNRKLPMHPKFLIPQSAQELGNMRIQYPKARLLAGGTDLALEVTQQLNDIDTIIYVKQVPELLRVHTGEDTLSIGAAVSLTRCMQVLAKSVPASEAMLLRYGSEQVRNQGTMGGNVINASPVGDLPPLLLALNATLILQSGDKVRGVNINEFYQNYKKTSLAENEFLRRVDIPIPTSDTHVFVHKISKRLDDDISAVCGVFCLQMEQNKIIEIRVAFGGMAATPARATNLENALRDKPFDEQNLQLAMAALENDFEPMSDARASAGYRLQVAANLLKRCYLALNNADSLLHVSDYVSG